MSHIQIRISDEEKQEVSQVLDTLGLNYSSAIKLFFKELVEKQELPFEAESKQRKVESQPVRTDTDERFLAQAESSFNKVSWNPFVSRKIG